MVIEISIKEIAIIGGSNYGVQSYVINDQLTYLSPLEDVEVISITKDSISLINSSIPSLPKKLSALNGTQLSNGDLVLSGGYYMSGYEDWDGYDDGSEDLNTEWFDVEVCNDEILHYKLGSNQWTKVGTMKNLRRNYSSVWIEGCLLTTGGENNVQSFMNNRRNIEHIWKTTSHHEEFSLNEGVKERKELPIVLKCHTATKFGHRKMIVCGGEGNSVSYPFSKL